MKAQALEKSKQRQAENGEIIALYALEETQRRPFEPISADRGKDGIAFEIEDKIELGFGEIAHRQIGAVGFGPEDFSVLGKGGGGVKPVCLSLEAIKLEGGGFT